MNFNSIYVGLYKIIVTSTTEFTAESIISATASGNVKVQRRIKGFDFNNNPGKRGYNIMISL